MNKHTPREKKAYCPECRTAMEEISSEEVEETNFIVKIFECYICGGKRKTKIKNQALIGTWK
jgi:uncharacterized protein with PIN domain